LIENSARGNWENLGIMAAACGVTVTGLLLMKEMAPRILLLGALLWVALAGTGASSPASGRRARAAVLGLGLGIAVIASYWLRWSVRFIGPDEWDFLCFYLNGQVAAHGLNFYDRGVFAEVFRQISIPYAPSRGFVNGYVNLTFLFWHERERPRAGLWAVLAVFVKPVMGVLLIDLLARRQWRGLSVAAGAALALGAATLSVFGAPVFMSYLFDNPTLRVAPRLYMQPVNQSLIATLIRALGHDSSAAPALANPIFLVTGGLLSLVSFGVLLTLRGVHRRWGMAILTTYALLIYPQTLHHYSVLLVVPLLMLYQGYRETRRDLLLVSMFIAAVFILMEYSAFSANLLVWAAVIGTCLWQDRLALELTAAKRTRVA